jgi:AcrR family transcriptional regulator
VAVRDSRPAKHAPLRGAAARPAAPPVFDADAADPVRAILDAAGELLDELGMDGLSTTAVATRAGVSTATLYRHFPDKHAVLHALVHMLQEERAAAIKHVYQRVATDPDWRMPLREATRTLYRMRLSRPGGRSTRRALQTSAELWQWDLQQNEELAAALARAIRRRNPAIGRAAAARVALVTVTASIAVLDLACLDDRRGPAIVEDGIAMREAYLAAYLD